MFGHRLWTGHLRGLVIGAKSQERNALTVSGVGHAFGSLRALDDVSLAVPQGRFVALLGVNGAGKTTLFSLITRLYSSRSGTIAVLGHDLRSDPGPALAALGVVFQSRALDADLTVAQNLRYHAALHGMPRAAARERAGEVLAAVGLTDKLDARVATLSGGQTRRAEIARALMHRPALLLLDEATAGLDVRARAEVGRLVRGLVAREGVGVLWATHIFEEIEPEDQVVVLHRGRVLADATAAEIAGDKGLAPAFLDLTGVPSEAGGHGAERLDDITDGATDNPKEKSAEKASDTREARPRADPLASTEGRKG